MISGVEFISDCLDGVVKMFMRAHNTTEHEARIGALCGGRIYIFEVGTSVPKCTYDCNGDAFVNPVIANCNGVFPAFSVDGDFEMRIENASGQILLTGPYNEPVKPNLEIKQKDITEKYQELSDKYVQLCSDYAELSKRLVELSMRGE